MNLWVQISVYLFIFGYVTLVGCSLLALAREADRVHGELKRLKIRAANAETISELEDIKVSLLVYASENCWHKHFASHAREVLNYINGRMKGGTIDYSRY
jgi:hypothetical protein